MNRQNLSILQVFQSIVRNCIFLSVLPEKIYHVSLQIHKNVLKGKLQSLKKSNITEFQTEVRLVASTNWKERRDLLAIEKKLSLKNVATLHVLNHLSVQGAATFCLCFCSYHEFDQPGN